MVYPDLSRQVYRHTYTYDTPNSTDLFCNILPVSHISQESLYLLSLPIANKQSGTFFFFPGDTCHVSGIFIACSRTSVGVLYWEWAWPGWWAHAKVLRWLRPHSFQPVLFKWQLPPEEAGDNNVQSSPISSLWFDVRLWHRPTTSTIIFPSMLKTAKRYLYRFLSRTFTTSRTCAFINSKSRCWCC